MRGEGFAYFRWRELLLECWAALFFEERDYAREWRKLKRE